MFESTDQEAPHRTLINCSAAHFFATSPGANLFESTAGYETIGRSVIASRPGLVYRVDPTSIAQPIAEAARAVGVAPTSTVEALGRQPARFGCADADRLFAGFCS